MIKTPVILLVEDNKDDIELMKLVLLGKGLATEIKIVRDGSAALDYLFGPDHDHNLMPTIVILDLKLPKVGGLDVLRRIRSEPRTKCLPVVVFSSSREQADVEESFRLGANSFVQKPIVFEEFRQAVESIGRYWFHTNVTPRGC